MHFLVHPAAVTSGTISVPGDKSISHRALMLGAISDGELTVTGFLQGEDCMATLAAVRAMGVQVDRLGATSLRIYGVGLHGLKEPDAALDLGNSGTGMRLFAGLLSGQSFNSILTGDASLTRRPMGRVIRPLMSMGAEIGSDDDLPPLRIHGGRRLAAIRYALPMASAQVKSAILLAALYADGETVIDEPVPTRDHTERMLRSLGVELHVANRQIMLTGRQRVLARDIEVPGDLSSAAFMLLAALIAPDCEVIIERVGVNPTRLGVIEVLRQMGGDIEVEPRTATGFEPIADIRVRSSRLQGIEVDPALVSLAIDEFPVLFIAAAVAHGRSEFRGIGELRVKESDRIAAMADGLRELGIQVNEREDGAVVHGGKLTGGVVDSCGDHRVAMSFAVAGTVAASPVKVLHTQAVDTSFPGFVGCMKASGADISDSDEEPGS